MVLNACPALFSVTVLRSFLLLLSAGISLLREMMRLRKMKIKEKENAGK